ncbi:MAG: DUF1992 domain-containing protein [Calditrichia bacterium]
MDPVELIAEEKIREAMENGEFDNLSCKGKPVDLSDYFKAPPHLRMAYDLLKNAGVLPPEANLKKEIEALRTSREKCVDEKERFRISLEINEKEAQLNIALEKFRRHFR